MNIHCQLTFDPFGHWASSACRHAFAPLKSSLKVNLEAGSLDPVCIDIIVRESTVNSKKGKILYIYMNIPVGAHSELTKVSLSKILERKFGRDGVQVGRFEDWL